MKFRIGYDFAVAIINDDYSALSDDNQQAIDTWFDKYNIGWITIASDKEENQIIDSAQCEITKLWGECIDVYATIIGE